MELIADLHIHSRFSRATSRDLDFLSLHRSALEKGIGLVGTGDFTHPGWLKEISEQLEPLPGGIFRLRPDLRRKAQQGLPAACSGEVRFVLQVEISSIYKKAGRTRKNHNLVYMPDLEAARRFTERLERVGNLASDGRPILGLDARDLLEIVLESDERAFLIPAHVWTPWFSTLGSKSGFDSVEACFGDLSEHVFAVETGLSSDPPMNWRLSAMDRYTLVSSSDAHSARNLGREANLLEIEPSFEALRKAIQTREGFLGTLEFYPEEGKYHLDGHRKCGLRLEPEETRAHGGRCPVCGGKITVGVQARVVELADRPKGYRPSSALPFESIVPLPEVCGEVLDVGSKSKRVRRLVERLLGRLGPELDILRRVPLEEIERVGGAPLREALRRVRAGELVLEGGYDGEFGTVKVFGPDERDAVAGQMAFLSPRKTRPAKKATPAPAPAPDAAPQPPTLELRSDNDPLAALNPDQRRAAETLSGPLLVVAGPGTGKTRTLVARMAQQVITGAARPEEILAISFTRQAAAELQERVLATVPGAREGAPLVTTFHALGLSLLQEHVSTELRVVDEAERADIAHLVGGGTRKHADALVQMVSLAKQHTDPEAHLPHPDYALLLRRYEEELADRRALDVDDLVHKAWKLLASDPHLASRVAARFTSVSVDEYQDVNDVQADLVRLLCPGGRALCAIGDPDQAIYGFRGAQPGHFARFEAAWPGAARVSLGTTYRLGEHVARTAQAVLGGAATPLDTLRDGAMVEVVRCPSVASEAEQVLVRLERILGGSSSFAHASGRAGEAELQVGFGDVVVLCRLKQQRLEIKRALERSSIPCQLVGEDEPHDPRSEKIALMTMHASKGREYDVVFVTGVEEGLLPLRLAGLDSDTDEERRLLYVALTRARKLAVLSYATRRTLFGRGLPGVPSRFLGDLPAGSALYTAPSMATPRPELSQLSLF